jgi:hypothetical protein
MKETKKRLWTDSNTMCDDGGDGGGLSGVPSPLPGSGNKFDMDKENINLSPSVTPYPKPSRNPVTNSQTAANNTSSPSLTLNSSSVISLQTLTQPLTTHIETLKTDVCQLKTTVETFQTENKTTLDGLIKRVENLEGLTMEAIVSKPNPHIFVHKIGEIRPLTPLTYT